MGRSTSRSSGARAIDGDRPPRVSGFRPSRPQLRERGDLNLRWQFFVATCLASARLACRDVAARHYRSASCNGATDGRTKAAALTRSEVIAARFLASTSSESQDIPTLVERTGPRTTCSATSGVPGVPAQRASTCMTRTVAWYSRHDLVRGWGQTRNNPARVAARTRQDRPGGAELARCSVDLSSLGYRPLTARV